MINVSFCVGESLAGLLEDHLREVWCVSHQEVSENEVREELDDGITVSEIESGF